ncbi:uncharacterized protein [Musca autumnalis]|uniref:uncharacterized protein n=1 Tax=Musca autumnalis TaxID=221902 RepID=UPI003CE6B043
MEFCKTIKPLTGECDWAIWKRKVKDLLDFYEGALDVVSRKITKPEPLKEGATEAVVKDYNTRSAFYRKTNGLAKTLIASTISDEIYMKVMDKESAADVWEALHQQFEATSKDQLFKMCTALFSFEWVENLDVSTHISKLKSLWTEINAGLELKGNQKLPELLLICKILHVLPSSFEMFKSSWMMITRDEDKSLDELIMQLCLYERNFKKPENVEGQEALVINEKYSKSKNVNAKKDSTCHYCKKKGHWIKECRKWIADGKPSKSQPVKNHTHVALHAMSNEVNIADSSLEWWFDNGATKHVTNSDKYFVKYEEFEQPNSIQSAGKECLKAIGKGKIELLSKVNNKERIVTLNDVWYVPTISRNLFSILAAHDRNPNSKFTSTTNECKMYVDEELVVHGQREINGTLYKLNVRPNSHTQNISLLEEKSVLQLYHERWGHQDYRHVKMKLKKEMGISVKNTSENCEPCIFGKSSRKPFGRRDAASEPGEIVSTDIGRFNDLIQDDEIQSGLNEESDPNIEPQDDQLAKDSPNLEEQNDKPTSSNPEDNLERNATSDSEFEDAISGSNDGQESEEENCNYRKLRNRKVIISKTTHDELAMVSQEFVNSIETPNSYSEATKGDQRSEAVSTPMESTTTVAEVQKSTNDFPYRQAVGAIMYLMLGTRPDLAFSVGVLSRSLESPTSEDVQRLKRVLRYIAGTLDYGIIYKTNGLKKLECYSDADYGGCMSTGRSTTGVVACYAGSPISWISQRQPTVSTSTTEAEIIAASEAAKELMWLKSLYNDLINYNEVPVIHIDNTAAIRLSQNPEFHKRTKHISLKHFFIREKVIEGDIIVYQISTEYQIADMMTKPLPKLRLLHFVNILNINHLNKGKC